MIKFLDATFELLFLIWLHGIAPACTAIVFSVLLVWLLF